MSRRMAVCAVLGAVVLSHVSPVSADYLYIDHIYSVTRTQDVVYGTGATFGGGSMDLLMDVWQPTDNGTAPVQSDRPAIVIQDGGAWTSGSKDSGRVKDFARYMAQRGFTVFATDYRQFGDSPVAGPGPWDDNLSFPSLLQIYPTVNVIKSGIEDFATAMSFVRANAELYDINPDMIGAAGGSAGAINALLLQYNRRTAHGEPFQAQAVVSLVGTMYGNYDQIRGPATETPPLFLLNGESDQLIPYSPDISPNLHNELETRGGGELYYEQWLHDLPDEDLNHGVDYDFHPWNKDDPEMMDTSKNVLERVADFLAYHLADGPVFIDPDPPLAGDISGDGQVDIGDFTLWGDAFGSTGASLSADLTGDGRVDIGDFTIWGDNFGATAGVSGVGPGAQAVPEPASVILLAIGMVSLFVYTRRRGPAQGGHGPPTHQPEAPAREYPAPM